MNIPGVTRRASLRQGRTAGPGQKQGATHKHTHSYKHTYFLINSTTNNVHIIHIYKLPPNNDRGMAIIMCEQAGHCQARCFIHFLDTGCFRFILMW